MLGIVDYGMGNLRSVTNACKYLGIPATVLTHPGETESCSALLVPGQGAFGDCMNHLGDLGFTQKLKQWIHEDRPYLGICLGLQILFEESEESPGTQGLGLFPGRVRRFPAPSGLKVPQMGWNNIRQHQPECPLFQGVDDCAFFYFVHSYYVETAAKKAIAATTDYGVTYTSALCDRSVMAVQFHPEKSQKQGLQLLKNFAENISS